MVQYFHCTVSTRTPRGSQRSARLAAVSNAAFTNVSNHKLCAAGDGKHCCALASDTKHHKHACSGSQNLKILWLSMLTADMLQGGSTNWCQQAVMLIAHSEGCVGFPLACCVLGLHGIIAANQCCYAGGGSRFSSPSSSGDGDTDFTYRTNEGSIRSLSCSSNTAELRMFSEPSTAAS